MVKTIKSPCSPSHDYRGAGQGWQDRQQQQQQQQHQQYQQQQFQFPTQQHIQTTMGQQGQLPTIQESFQLSTPSSLGQKPFNFHQSTEHHHYNSGTPLGTSPDYLKKGSKALYVPPTEPFYPFTPTNYLSNYVQLVGNENESPALQKFETVHQYPQKDNYKGKYCFQLIFPYDSSKLVVSLSSTHSGNKHMNTINGSTFTAFITHTASPSAVVRFFLVYSNDAKSTMPVNPCKNHQLQDHPNHMLTVEGSGDAIYEEHHHSSVVVTPTPTGDIVNHNPSCPKYCVQVEFHCRNSCLNRKDLTLVCQLEESGIVYGRECLEVKISASPRRDAKPKDKKKTTVDPSTSNGLVSLPCPQTVKRTSDEAFKSQSEEVLTTCDELQRFAYFCYMETRFQKMFPEQHREAKLQFPSWWTARWNSIEDI